MRLKLLIATGLAAACAAPLAWASPAHPAGACRAWHARALLSGQGWLESLAFDGRGGITISALAQGRVLRLASDGRLTTLVAGVSAPGGEIVRGSYLYFTTGDILPPAANGTIDRLDLRTRKLSVWARGLTMPNGLGFLPSGDAIVTRDIETGAPPTDVTLVPAHRPRIPHRRWALVPDTNGAVVDPSGRWLYVDRTFSKNGAVDRILIAHPRRVQVVARLGAGVAPDDMSIAGGIIYVPGFADGKIYRLDPQTHALCAIASGLGNPTAVVFGGAGWPTRDLFVTTAGGQLFALAPPRRA